MSDITRYDTSGEVPEEIKKTTRLVLPRIKMLQSGSNEVKKMGLKAGMFYNAGTGETTKEIKIVPLIERDDRVLWKAGNLLCTADPKTSWVGQVKQTDMFGGNEEQNCGSCPYNRDVIVASGKKPPASQSLWCNFRYNFLVLTYPLGEVLFPSIISFQRTNARAGATIRQYQKMAPKVPAFGHVFKLVIPDEPRRFDAGEAYVSNIYYGGVIQPADIDRVSDLLLVIRGSEIDLHELEPEDGGNGHAHHSTK